MRRQKVDIGMFKGNRMLLEVRETGAGWVAAPLDAASMRPVGGLLWRSGDVPQTVSGRTRRDWQSVRRRMRLTLKVQGAACPRLNLCLRKSGLRLLSESSADGGSVPARPFGKRGLSPLKYEWSGIVGVCCYSYVREGQYAEASRWTSVWG